MSNFFINSSVTYARYFLVTALTFFLLSCGFQLRGSLELSDKISPLYIQKNSAFELARELRTFLATNDIALTDRASRSYYQLTLIRENKNRRVLTVDGDGRAREYLLTYTVNFSIASTKTQGQPVNDFISLTRSLLFNPDAVLAVTNESEVLYKDMQRNAARLILLKLQARANADLVSSKNIVAPQVSSAQ